MSDQILRIKTISEIHQLMGLSKPKHPLISLVDATKMVIDEKALQTRISYDFYMVSLKDKSCGVDYGRKSIDFDEGVMGFSAPNKVYKPTRIVKEGEINGWILFFHPDLIRNTSLGEQIDDYSFFNYDTFEALHLAEEEENTLEDVVRNIEREYEQRIDNLSQRVIVTNIELLLNYSLRYYERQFNTRSSQSKDIVSSFNRNLKSYHKSEMHLEDGVPSIQYFADKANLSQHYFSDLLKKETGRTPKDFINEFVINKAKTLILRSNNSISEIAYDLGFNYPHYFTRLFKSKTGVTPLEYRNLN